MGKIIIYDEDARQFVMNKSGVEHTLNIYSAAEFNTIDAAQTFANTHFPYVTVSYLKVVA